MSVFYVDKCLMKEIELNRDIPFGMHGCLVRNLMKLQFGL